MNTRAIPPRPSKLFEKYLGQLLMAEQVIAMCDGWYDKHILPTFVLQREIQVGESGQVFKDDQWVFTNPVHDLPQGNVG